MVKNGLWVCLKLANFENQIRHERLMYFIFFFITFKSNYMNVMSHSLISDKRVDASDAKVILSQVVNCNCNVLMRLVELRFSRRTSRHMIFLNHFYICAIQGVATLYTSRCYYNKTWLFIVITTWLRKQTAQGNSTTKRRKKAIYIQSILIAQGKRGVTIQEMLIDTKYT